MFKTIETFSTIIKLLDFKEFQVHHFIMFIFDFEKSFVNF